jgi:hypothetical protein
LLKEQRRWAAAAALTSGSLARIYENEPKNIYENKPTEQQRQRIDLRFARALGRQEARSLRDDPLRLGRCERAGAIMQFADQPVSIGT